MFGFNVSAKRLGIFFVWGAVTYIVLRIGIHFLPEPPQYVHLRQVKQHVTQIARDWTTFRSTNSGLDLVSFYPETRGDGLFGVRGYVTSEAHAAQAIQFVQSTHPPRPMYTNQLQVVDAESYAFYREMFSGPGGAANGNQPIRSETNSTTAATGSRR